MSMAGGRDRPPKEPQRKAGPSPGADSGDGTGFSFEAAARRLAGEMIRPLVRDGVVAPNDVNWLVERACSRIPNVVRRAWRVGNRSLLEEILTLRIRHLAEFRYYRNVQYSALRTKLVNRAQGLVHDPQVAEDLVQETFKRAIKGANGYRGDGSYETWLATILLNVIRADRRSGNGTLVPDAVLSGLKNTGLPRERSDALVDFLYGPRQTPEKMVLEREIVGKLFRLVRVLLTDSYSYRVIFLRFVEGKSPQEVARILGVTVSHCYKILANARKRLRNSPSVRSLLEQEGIHGRPSKK